MQKIYFWKYQGNARNYPGYHLSLNNEAAEVISRRLRSCLSMKMERSVRIELMKPTDDLLSVPNNRINKSRSRNRLELSIRFDGDVELLHIVETPDTIVVELSPSKTNELLEGIAGLMIGENDYAMWGRGVEGVETCIWFW